MSRVLACLFIAGAFALWSPPLRAEISANKDCDGVTPVGGALAPMHDTNNGSIRSAGATPNVRCKNQMTPNMSAPAPKTPPAPVAVPPAETAPTVVPDGEEHHSTHLDMEDEEPGAAPNHNPWMSPPPEDSFGGDRWRSQ